MSGRIEKKNAVGQAGNSCTVERGTDYVQAPGFRRRRDGTRQNGSTVGGHGKVGEGQDLTKRLTEGKRDVGCDGGNRDGGAGEP